MRVGLTGLVDAKWTDRILDECFENLAAHRPELSPARLARTRWLMNNAMEDALVTGYESLIEGLTLPDPDDRHVLAAAVRAGAQVIVTANLKDFPVGVLAPLGVTAMHPDEFVTELIDLAPELLLEVIVEQAASLRSPAQSVDQLLVTLRENGLARAVARLRVMSGP